MRAIRFRYSLLTLVTLVGAFAFACAALRSATEFWASAVFTLCVGLVLLGSLAIVFQRGPARTFWIGFVWFCGAYMGITFGPWCNANVKDHLVTSKLLGYLHRQIAVSPAILPNAGYVLTDVDNDGITDVFVTGQSGTTQLLKSGANGKFVVFPGQTGSTTLSVANSFLLSTNTFAGGPAWEYFERVGHSLFGMIAGFLGGLVSLFLWRSRNDQRRGQPETQESQTPPI